jgi:hypothetical protein
VSQVCDVTNTQYVQDQKKYDAQGYKHYDCSCDTGADKDAWASRNGVPEDNILAPILFGGLVGGIKAGVRGIAEGLFGGGAKTAAEQTAAATTGTVFNAGKGLLQGEAELSSHAAAQAALKGVTKEEIAEALSQVPKQEAGRGSVLRFIGKAAEVRVNRVTGTIVTVIRFVSPGAPSPLQ